MTVWGDSSSRKGYWSSGRGYRAGVDVEPEDVRNETLL
jgi:hypothetical protein